VTEAVWKERETPSPKDFTMTDTTGQTDLQVPSSEQIKAFFDLLVDAFETPAEDALEDIKALLKEGRTIVSQDYLAKRWARPKQTVSDWLAKWRAEGLIPEATLVGRCKAIVT
jgi:hypothetical protein